MSLFSFQFSELLVFFSFKINQEYIAKNLCVEKDIEGSTCQGCCQLKKRLNEQEKQKKELPPQQHEKQNIDFCEPKSENPMAPFPYIKSMNFKTPEAYSFITVFEVFHPPS